MKFQATIKTEETIEFEVELPYFCKKDDRLYKVISEREVIEIDPSPTYTKILKKGLWLCESDIATGMKIEEVEFNEAYNKTLFEIGKYVPAPDAPKELLNDEYTKLAWLMNDILGEQTYPDCPDFIMPLNVIKQTADALKKDDITMYYVGIIDDYGGYLDAEYEKHMDEQNINTESVNQ